jgi:hypothetical protein
MNDELDAEGFDLFQGTMPSLSGKAEKRHGNSVRIADNTTKIRIE